MSIGPISPNMLPVGAVGQTDLVDQIIEAERAPIQQAENRRQHVIEERNEYSDLSGMLNELDKVTSGIRHESRYSQFKVESSHPEILEGQVTGATRPGNFEMEIRGLAQQDRHLDIGFPDRNETPVGFGFMEIAGEDGRSFDVVIEPGSTLQDVAETINASTAGVTAQIVNTGFEEDPFRLLVTSDESGQSAKINLDPDTTFLDFQNIKSGRNLDAVFEDVAVTSKNNSLAEVVEGVQLTAKQAQPGTKIQVSVNHDIDKTFSSIKEFTEKYNKVASYANESFTYTPGQERKVLAGDSGLRSVMRNLQRQVASPNVEGTGFGSLAEVGITTNAKTGELQLDENKLRTAMAKNYQGVAKLFVDSESGRGVAGRMADALKSFRDPVHGIMKNRIRSLDHMIKEQDKQIEMKNSRLDERREFLKRQFASLQQRTNGLENQNQVLTQRLGSPNT